MTDDDEVDIIGEFGDEMQSKSLLGSSVCTLDEMGVTMNELLPYLGTNSWLLNSDQVWCTESPIESKATIEVEKSGNSKGKTNHLKETKVIATSHHKPWSDSEKQLFQKGFELHGSSWPAIAKHVGTRTSLQVKNYARRYFLQAKPTAGPLPLNASEVIRMTKEADSCESKDVDIEDLVDGLDVDEQSKLSPEIGQEPNKQSSMDDVEEMTKHTSPDEVDGSMLKPQTQKTDESSKLEFVEERVFTFAKPNSEVTLERDVILDEEKVVHQEFFEGRPLKTPERYLKIRNYIVDSWTRSRPAYLNKTSVRTGLKNCGDVNCIGRIHAYLEQIGGINFGCEQTVYNRPLVLVGKPVNSSKKSNQTIPASQQLMRTDVVRPRKRRAPVLTFDSSVGGYTIRHDENGQTVDIVESFEGSPAVRRRKNAKTEPESNPFRLIPCTEFGTQAGALMAPFTVHVDAKALVIMDIHAHLSNLEVIGLLGGNYDEHSAVLNVSAAEPCESLTSTGSECEMDPVSQTQACERLQQSGITVVGWYHSHPTFSPNPSLRDLETQSKFQEWFGQGGSHFLGVIVSPHHSPSSASSIRYMMVGEEMVQPENYRRPYKFFPRFTALEHNLTSFMADVERLISKWMPLVIGSESSQPTLMTMNKLISSIHHHLMNTNQEDQSNVLPFLCAVGNIIVSHLPHNHTNDQDDEQQDSMVSTFDTKVVSAEASKAAT